MINIYSKIPNAKNFTYLELIESTTALRLGINNIPPNDGIWKNLELLAVNSLQPIRNRFGPIRVTSGYRSTSLCIAIRSSINSNHTRGQAADIEPFHNSAIKLIDILNWIHDNLEYRELIAEYFPAGWIHITYRKGGNKKILKLKDRNHHYKRVSIDYINNIYR